MRSVSNFSKNLFPENSRKKRIYCLLLFFYTNLLQKQIQVKTVTKGTKLRTKILLGAFCAFCYCFFTLPNCKKQQRVMNSNKGSKIKNKYLHSVQFPYKIFNLRHKKTSFNEIVFSWGIKFSLTVFLTAVICQNFNLLSDSW